MEYVCMLYECVYSDMYRQTSISLYVYAYMGMYLCIYVCIWGDMYIFMCVHT